MFFKHELQNVISGTSRVTKGVAIQAIAHYLRKSKASGAIPEKKELLKEQETSAIINYCRLNNYFFPATRYELVGFINENKILSAVVKQPYIISTENTDENAVKEIMALNSFSNTKNCDYFNKELGIILEDLHDENVLTNKGVLFFTFQKNFTISKNNFNKFF